MSTEPGAIPTTTTTTPSTPPNQLESISQANERRQLRRLRQLQRLRRWKELGRSPLDFARPFSFSEAIVRMKRNLSYFYAQYATIMFIIVLWFNLHTFMKIVFLIVFLGWFFLYCYRDEPLVVFNHTFDNDSLGIIFYVFYLALMFVRGFVLVWWKVLLVSLPIGALLVGLHALFRVTDDRFLNEQEAADEGLLLGV